MFIVSVRPRNGWVCSSVTSCTPPASPGLLVTSVTRPTLTPCRTTAVPCSTPWPTYGVADRDRNPILWLLGERIDDGKGQRQCDAHDQTRADAHQHPLLVLCRSS